MVAASSRAHGSSSTSAIRSVTTSPFSVITRALGPEASVQVDIDIFPAKAGDLFLLCSDGLTSMVHEPKLRPLFEETLSLLEREANPLVARRPQGGGFGRKTASY